jgi:hypothetical protein
MGDIYTHRTSSTNWRTSLVPAPAVIPAPRAYINAVAVKGFVVELRVPQVDGAVLCAFVYISDGRSWH